jgi:hypothetical protein
MNKNEYFVYVHTANNANAGTDCKVSIKINDASDFVHLNNSEDNFQRNDYDSFAIFTDDVGDIKSITLKLGNEAVAAPTWECDYVIVTSYHYNSAKFKVDCKFKKKDVKTFKPV